MSHTQKDKKSDSDKKQARTDKKHIKHDPQAESARAKFGKEGQSGYGN